MVRFGRKTLIAIGAVALLSGGYAIAQIVTPPTVQAIGTGDLFQDIPGGTSGPTNIYATILQMRSYILGYGSAHLGTPALTTTTSICGGSAATILGTDNSGQITEGSSNTTSCVVTFAKAFVTAPECFTSINNVTDTSLKCATTATTLTITSSSANSNLINYEVLGLPGG